MSNNKNDMSDIVKGIRNDFEACISDPSRNPTYELIRTSDLIDRIHRYLTGELEDRGIDSSSIYMDRDLYGYPKSKSQDIIVHNEDSNMITGPEMSINVRSQLSSIGKNMDTIQERIIAESTSIHGRFPRLPTGYVFMLPKRGYDSDAKSDNVVERTEEYNLQKAIEIFSSIAGRDSVGVGDQNYDAIWLILFDTDNNPPDIITDIRTLEDEDIVTEQFAEMYESADYDILDEELFFDTMTRKYRDNYPKLL